MVDYSLTKASKNLWTSIGHPHINGQTKVANKVILNKLKKKLGQLKGLWADEIPIIF